MRFIAIIEQLKYFKYMFEMPQKLPKNGLAEIFFEKISKN